MMTERKADLRPRAVITCNFRAETASVRKGASAFVVSPNFSDNRLAVLVATKANEVRRVREQFDNLERFRVQELEPNHPLYADGRLFTFDRSDGKHLALMNRLRGVADTSTQLSGLAATIDAENPRDDTGLCRWCGRNPRRHNASCAWKLHRDRKMRVDQKSDDSDA